MVGGTAYVASLLDYGSDLGRQANSFGFASTFFDTQGRAFLDGHLSVPTGSLGIEGFVQRGSEYTYFGPWPAIVRLPVLLTTREFDGRLTVLSMGLAFVVLALMLPRLFWLVRDLVRPGELVTTFEAVSAGAFLALAAGGTSLTFVASLPWAYHEVYAWSIALTVGAMYWMLRTLVDPTRASIGWLFAFATAMILTRATGGWAVCLAGVAVGCWLWSGRLGGEKRRWGARVVLVAVAALLIGAAVNWLKFRHPFAFPLEDQRFTSISDQRRDALAANGGTIMGPQFFPTALSAYFRPDGLRFVDYFPWITLPAEPVAPVDGVVIDQSYRTASVTALMPWLLVMTVVATGAIFRPGVSQGRRLLRVPLVAGVLMTGGVMAYGYFATRYTAEFVPALIVGGAIGTVMVTRSLQRRSVPIRSAFLALTVGATVFGITANLLLGYAAVATTTRGTELDSYLALQQRLSPAAQDSLVTESRGAPDRDEGSTDDLWIQGDCDALFLNTGDQGTPWTLVERRGLLVTATLGPDLEYARVKLFESATDTVNEVWLQVTERGRFRLQIVTGDDTFSGQWVDLLPPYQVRVGVRVLTELSYADVTSDPGGHLAYLRAFEVDGDGNAAPVEVREADHDRTALAAAGLRIETSTGLAPTLCQEIRDRS